MHNAEQSSTSSNALPHRFHGLSRLLSDPRVESVLSVIMIIFLASKAV